LRVDDLADPEQAEISVLVGHAAALDALDLGGRDRESCRQLVQLHVDGDVVPQPGDRDSQNCLRTRRSPSQSARMSAKWYFSCATRSMPQPNANPDHASGSTPTFSRTRGSTIPAPPISSHPECLHVRQPSPPQIPQETSGSIDGSVNGK